MDIDNRVKGYMSIVNLSVTLVYILCVYLPIQNKIAIAHSAIFKIDLKRTRVEGYEFYGKLITRDNMIK